MLDFSNLSYLPTHVETCISNQHIISMRKGNAHLCDQMNVSKTQKEQRRPLGLSWLVSGLCSTRSFPRLDGTVESSRFSMSARPDPRSPQLSPDRTRCVLEKPGQRSRAADDNDVPAYPLRVRRTTSMGDDAIKVNGRMDSSYKPRSSAGGSRTGGTPMARRYIEDRLREMYQDRRAFSFRPRTTETALSHGPSYTTSRAHVGSRSRQATTQNGASTISVLSPLGRFRMVAKIAGRLHRLREAIITNSREKTPRSATELQWMTLYGQQEEDGLAFNKHLFSRDRVIAQIPDWALVILQLKPEQRSEQHCRRLHALLRGLRSFDKFTEEIQMSLCRAFTLEKVEERRVVLRRGHVGLSFYFIYSGSVFVNAEDVTPSGTSFVKTVAVLSRGDSFGELALLQDIRRTATVSVRESCELLVVDRDVFAMVCPEIFERELAEKQAFISKLDLFSGRWWSPEALRALSMNAQIQEYKTNKVIVADTTEEDWIYACMEGKCQIIRCLSLDAPLKQSSDRKLSEVVLSEEILELLSDSNDRSFSTDKVDGGDMRENMLSSLGLDYVRSGRTKLIYAQERKSAIHGTDGPTTLTRLMARQKEQLKKDLVYLHVGELEAGQVFDLPSLFEDFSEDKTAASTLMLVSGGAKVIKVKKAAFSDHASQQALDHTRTLASKQANPSEDVILESYKCKVAWDDFKTKVVKSVIKCRNHRSEPLYRSSSDTRRRFNFKAQKRISNTSQIITALTRGQDTMGNNMMSSWVENAYSEEDTPVPTPDSNGPDRDPTPRVIQWDSTLLEGSSTSRISNVGIVRRKLSSPANKPLIFITRNTTRPKTISI